MGVSEEHAETFRFRVERLFQALGGAVHNVDRCRTPVLIYAGAAPFTLDGELRGSRNEFIFWLQGLSVSRAQI